MKTIDRRDLLDLILAEFPDVAVELKNSGEGLLHIEVAMFRQATERAIDAGQFWTAEKHFRFVDRILQNASPDVDNALRISYLEDLALGDCTSNRHRAVKERMPARMRAELIRIHSNWR